ncbi:unnamed protein product [Boreogadus saida]
MSCSRAPQSQPSPPAQPDPPRPTAAAAAAAAVPPATVPATVRAASPAQAIAGSFSRMSSISSLFRSHRRGNAQATPVPDAATPPASGRSGPSVSGGNPWGIGTLSETPTEVNPGLFLGPPSPDFMPNDAQVFPALREINLDSIQAPEPRGREEFLQYAVQLTLDPDTAHRRLALSDGDTKATLQAAAAAAADTPQRFDGWTQALSRGPLGGAGPSYWEVEWRGRGSSVGVAYGSLARKGGDGRAGLGYNARSWSLELSDTRCVAAHDNERRDIAVGYSPRVGVFLDPAAGTLGFYSVADGMSHLHTFRANFTRPLYAAVGVGVGVGMDFALGQFSSSADSVKLCPM